jgi:hypothetical protein
MQSLRNTCELIGQRQRVLCNSVDFHQLALEWAAESPDATVPADTRDVLEALQRGDLSSLPDSWFERDDSTEGRFSLRLDAFENHDTATEEPSPEHED